jgi:hypothetical protein
MRTVDPALTRYGTDFIATGAPVLVVVGCGSAAYVIAVICGLLSHHEGPMPVLSRMIQSKSR